MCETLTFLKIKDILKYNDKSKYDPKPSITEPDNGQKTEPFTNLDLTQESDRLETFNGWKSDALSPVSLAKAGFYFLNNPLNPDLVKCAFCKAEICRWESGDDALEEHIKWSPNCPFARQLTRKSPLAFLHDRNSGQDVCGNAEVFPNSLPESETFRLLNSMYKSYDDVQTRLESFENWPKSSRHKPEVLAEAGFYYRGVEDHTICHKCKGALRDWKDEDDPWEQHAMWFPNCRYLLEKKGQKYVDDVQSKLRSVVPCSSNSTKETQAKLNCEQGGSASRDDGIVLCRICDSNERNVIFRPCNHIIACEHCSRLMDKCPVCRNPIDDRMKVFLS